MELTKEYISARIAELNEAIDKATTQGKQDKFHFYTGQKVIYLSMLSALKEKTL